MNHIYDQSELTKHLFCFGTIDGPDVSYVGVGDHPSDIILLEEENLYNQIWSHWDYEQVLLWNSSPAGMPAPLAFLNNQKSNTNVQDIPAHLQGLLLLNCYSCHREPALLAPFLHNNNNHNQEQAVKLPLPMDYIQNQTRNKWENCDTTRCANHCIHTRMQKIKGGNLAQKKEI